jgi:AraC-like DNA-binding protein
MSAESLDSLPLDTVIHCQGVSEIESLFHEIAFLHSSPSLCQAQEISLMFHFLVCRLFCCSQNAVKLDNPLVKNCVSIINANPQKLFTTEELADRLFVSCRTLRNQFKTVYGQTLYRFQRENKLQLSLNYLTNYPNMKFYDIAVNLGFYDEFHFSKVFKKRYGCPPSVYKKLIKNNN